jgi:tetratricopeptide (TPR) repeat protein
VLSSIEIDPFYSSNRAFGCQVNLLRARLRQGMNDRTGGQELAARVSAEAASMGDLRLKLEATLLAEILTPEDSRPSLIENLSTVAAQASESGQNDIYYAAILELGRADCRQGRYESAERRFGDILNRPGQPRMITIQTCNVLGGLRLLQRRYDEAIEILAANEATAAATGYLPLALEAAVLLGDVYRECSKERKVRETLGRAEAYMGRLQASLPPHTSPEVYLSGLAPSHLLKLRAGLSDKEYVISGGGRP